ncbi:MAG: class II aldolase/adducin family protein [Pseudorhodoplanes sp.]
MTGANRNYSSDEWKARVELAAAYRAIHHWGWAGTIYNHITLRIPGTHDQFLINNYGLTYDEITASNLVKIDINGKILGGPPDANINLAGYIIHSAIHAARHDIDAIVHTHTPSGVAVSAMEDGLLPLGMESTILAQTIGYHDFEGISVDEGEKVRLVADLGNHIGLILRNHGLLTVGRTISEAIARIWLLERACDIQVRALAGGKVRHVAKHVQEQIAEQAQKYDKDGSDDARMFAAMMRRLDRLDPSYRN